MRPESILNPATRGAIPNRRNTPTLRVAGFEDDDEDENEAPHEWRQKGGLTDVCGLVITVPTRSGAPSASPTRHAGAIRTWRSTPILQHSVTPLLRGAGFEDEDDDEDENEAPCERDDKRQIADI